MRWTRDDTGRFSQRPYYDRDELDHECEKIIISFLDAKYSKVNYPITTNDLTVLIEQHVSDLDLYADLTDVGTNVEGVTDFLAGQKPRVRISQELQVPGRENRFRSTLAHELGHVKFHDHLWPHNQMELFAVSNQEQVQRCKRESIFSTSQVDWMEWQAGYASGSFLMPIRPLKNLIQQHLSEFRSGFPLLDTSLEGRILIQLTKNNFQVSFDAARVRLLQLGYLTDKPIPQTSISIFG